jgi:hypothetical protein
MPRVSSIVLAIASKEVHRLLIDPLNVERST